MNYEIERILEYEIERLVGRLITMIIATGIGIGVVFLFNGKGPLTIDHLAMGAFFALFAVPVVFLYRKGGKILGTIAVGLGGTTIVKLIEPFEELPNANIIIGYLFIAFAIVEVALIVTSFIIKFRKYSKYLSY